MRPAVLRSNELGQTHISSIFLLVSRRSTTISANASAPEYVNVGLVNIWFQRRGPKRPNMLLLYMALTCLLASICVAQDNNVSFSSRQATYKPANVCSSSCLCIRPALKSDIEVTMTELSFGDNPGCSQKHLSAGKKSEHCPVNSDASASKVVSVQPDMASAEHPNTEGSEQLTGAQLNTQASSEFKLRDASGKMIADGTVFALKVINEDGGDFDGEESDLAGLTEDERQFFGRQWLVGSILTEGGMYRFDAMYASGDYFTSETVNGVVYFKHDGNYLCHGLDDGRSVILASRSIPTKEQRIRIHYDDSDNSFKLTPWNTEVFAICEWLKSSCGVVDFYDGDPRFHSTTPMKLHIIQF